VLFVIFDDLETLMVFAIARDLGWVASHRRLPMSVTLAAQPSNAAPDQRPTVFGDVLDHTINF